MEKADLQMKEKLIGRRDELEKEVRKNPYIPEVHIQLAEIYEKLWNYVEAYKNYKMAFFLYNYEKNEEGIITTASSIEQITEKMNQYAENLEDDKLKNFCEDIRYLNEQERNAFGFYENSYRSTEKSIGKYYNKKSKLFLGGYRMPLHLYQNDELDLIHMCGEFIQVVEGNQVQIQGEGECFLPIATEQDITEHIFVKDGVQKNILQNDAKRFRYYRISGGTAVFSAKKAYYGKPIPLGFDLKKKKIVLNIFVDGLAQCELQGSDFKKYMPNTYHFFKNGMICKQAYSAGEWTYPSIANYVSGRYTTDHMMFHNDIDWHLPKETKTLAEYFQDEGYYTYYMGGDWRIIPTYGHARGYDRFMYRMIYNGFNVEQIIPEAIGQIEAMKETNQFLWISIGDLHNIADEIELPTSVQNRLKLEDQIIEESGPTSVKQPHSECKRHQYEMMLPYIDLYLGILFRYLEENYSDEEMIVSLFADHGQGYLIPEDGEFLGNERTNVAMMFRDVSYQNMQTDEIISSVDYTAIMCKLAGIPYNACDTAGKLPRVFGGSGRKWALVESLHPNDPFRAALYGEQYTFFFCNDFPVGNDGRFRLVDYETKLVDKEGQIVENEYIKKECVDIILERIDHLILK